MINGQDIDAFEAENTGPIRAACKFADRQARGLPPDRWASAEFQHQVARGIRALLILVETQAAALQAAHDELSRGSSEGS